MNHAATTPNPVYQIPGVREPYTVGQWAEITEDRWFEMLEVLPPMRWTKWKFMVCEPLVYSTRDKCSIYGCFASVGGKYYESNQPSRKTDAELHTEIFRLETEEVAT